MWHTFKLGDLVDNFSERAKNNGGATNLNFLGVSNEEGITISKYAAEDKAEDYKIIEKGCFAYNPYRINVGSIALMNDNIRGLISPAYVVFKLKPASIIPELLLKFLKSSEGLRQIKLYARGSVRQALRFEDLCKIEIRLPDFDEQLKLVKNLDVVYSEGNRLFTEQNNQLDLLKKLRQQILQDAVKGKLVSQDPGDEPASELLERIKEEKEQLIKEKKIRKEKPLPEIKPEEIPFDIPENWVWCRLYDICESIVDCPHSTPKYLDYDSGFYGIDTNCINDNGEIVRLRPLSEEGYHERVRRLIPHQNDIVYAREGSIGLATFIPKDKSICLGQRVMLFRASSKITPRFLKLVVTEEQYKNRLLEKHRGMGAKHVNVKDIVNSLIGLPPLQEQNLILSKVEKLMKLCDEQEQSINQNQKYTKELLQVALKEALEN